MDKIYRMDMYMEREFIPQSVCTKTHLLFVDDFLCHKCLPRIILCNTIGYFIFDVPWKYMTLAYSKNRKNV